MKRKERELPIKSGKLFTLVGAFTAPLCFQLAAVRSTEHVAATARKDEFTFSHSLKCILKEEVLMFPQNNLIYLSLNPLKDNE